MRLLSRGNVFIFERLIAISVGQHFLIDINKFIEQNKNT